MLLRCLFPDHQQGGLHLCQCLLADTAAVTTSRIEKHCRCPGCMVLGAVQMSAEIRPANSQESVGSESKQATWLQVANSGNTKAISTFELHCNSLYRNTCFNENHIKSTWLPLSGQLSILIILYLFQFRRGLSNG